MFSPSVLFVCRKFVKAKKYKTEAEKFGWSFVLEMFVPEEVSKEAKDRIKVVLSGYAVLT